jgi:hypothetical protein
VGLVAQNAVAYIIIMRNLDVVEEDHILQFHRVTDHTVFSHQGAAPDEGTVADFRIGTDDAGGTQKCGGGDCCGLMYPDGGADFGVIFSQTGTKGQNQILNSLQRLPGIVKAGKVVACQRMGQIVKIAYMIHNKYLPAEKSTSILYNG